MKNCLKLLIYFLCSSFVLCSASMLQKIIAGFNPFIWKAYIIPFIYGGFSGLIIGVNHLNSKKSKEKIQKQLEEKELILKEVQHRIKNNIHSIKAILSMKVKNISNPEAKEIINESIMQIEGMYQIYQKLVITDSYSEISSKSYLEDLIKSIRSISQGTDIDVRTEIEDITFDVKEMFSIACIVNEIITNSIKHAFKKTASAIIKVKMEKQNDKIMLSIKDNGRGLDDNFDLEKSAGFGLLLTKLMAQQLEAEFSMTSNDGTLSTISFNI